MVKNGAAFRQVPVGVVRDVDDSGFVGCGGVIEAEHVVIGEGVDDGGGERAGITFLAVGADVGETDRGALFAADDLGFPDDFVEASEPAVEVVGAVVGGQRVCPAVEGESAPGDAVGIAPDRGAEIGMAVKVS
jgi:hypothetical protein